MKIFFVTLKNGSSVRINADFVNEYDSYTLDVNGSHIMFEFPIMSIKVDET